MVRMSKRPRKSLSEMVRSNMVLYMSAEVPLYHGNMGMKSGCSSTMAASSLNSPRSHQKGNDACMPTAVGLPRMQAAPPAQKRCQMLAAILLLQYIQPAARAVG